MSNGLTLNIGGKRYQGGVLVRSDSSQRVSSPASPLRLSGGRNPFVRHQGYSQETAHSSGQPVSPPLPLSGIQDTQGFFWTPLATPSATSSVPDSFGGLRPATPPTQSSMGTLYGLPFDICELVAAQAPQIMGGSAYLRETYRDINLQKDYHKDPAQFVQKFVSRFTGYNPISPRTPIFATAYNFLTEQEKTQFKQNASLRGTSLENNLWLLSSGDLDVIKNLSMNREIQPEILDRLVNQAQGEHRQVLYQNIANNRNASPEALRTMFQNTRQEPTQSRRPIQYSLARHSNTPENVLILLQNLNNLNINRNLASNPRITPNRIVTLTDNAMAALHHNYSDMSAKNILKNLLDNSGIQQPFLDPIYNGIRHLSAYYQAHGFLVFPHSQASNQQIKQWFMRN